MIKGRHEEALKSLARLHARGNINDHFVQGEYQEMETKVQQEAINEGGWSQIFKDRYNLRKVILRDHAAFQCANDWRMSHPLSCSV